MPGFVVQGPKSDDRDSLGSENRLIPIYNYDLNLAVVQVHLFIILSLFNQRKQVKWS